MEKEISDGRILVTGGAGFIGANLVRMLLDHGYQVTMLDNLSTGRHEYLDGLDIEFIEGDILDTELVNRIGFELCPPTIARILSLDKRSHMRSDAGE